jgi:hypothetical protein
MRLWSGVLILLGCLSFIACDDSSPTSPTVSQGTAGSSGGNTQTPDPSTPGGSANVNCNNSRGTLTAQVNGATWTATCVTSASWVANVFSLSAVRGDEVLTLTVNAGFTGTYDALNSSASGTLVRTTSGATWASGPGGTVSVVLTRLDLQAAIGTFSFTGMAAPGTAASGTRIVSNGTFSVTF